MTISSTTPLQITSLQSRVARVREALAGCGAFFAAARRPDPLPTLRDLAGDWLCAEEIEILVPAGTGPLRSDEPGRLYGTVQIGRRVVGRIEARRRKPFDEDDRALMAALGQIIGAALEHAALQGEMEQYARQAQAHAGTLEQLLRYGRTIVSAAADPHAVALQIATQLPEMVGGERASVLLLAPDAQSQPLLLLSNGHRSTPERAREVSEHGLAGMVLRDRAPLMIDETDTDRRWLGLRLSQNDLRTRCAMAVPLLWGEHAIGALTVTTTQSRHFDPAQLDLLELVACHVAMAVHAANLEAQLPQLAVRLATLADELDAALRAAAGGDQAALQGAWAVAARLRAEQAGLLVHR